MERPAFYEFFAGGGMAHAGLSDCFSCAFANDFDAGKAGAYRANWPGAPFRDGDIHALSPADLPGRAALVWGSFPCQDLSLAGRGGGLNAATRSGAFFGLTKLLAGLRQDGRAPKIVALENVTGLLTSHGGADFHAVCGALDGLGYRFGALAMDAARFLPQSRPRLLLVALRGDVDPGAFAGEGPAPEWSGAALARAVAGLPGPLRDKHLWWRLPPAPARNSTLAEMLLPDGAAEWFSPERAGAQIALMTPAHRDDLRAREASGARHVGALFRRMRKDDAGRSVQRAEPRFDGLAGCLRTPAGGSSRQILIVVDRGETRMRLIAPREAARLMGLPDDYRLPARAGAALKLAGDGVAVPVVRHLAAHLLAPLAEL